MVFPAVKIWYAQIIGSYWSNIKFNQKPCQQNINRDETFIYNYGGYYDRNPDPDKDTDWGVAI